MRGTVEHFSPDVAASDVATAIDEHGYALIESLLSDDQVDEKRAELARLVATTPAGRNDFEGFATHRVYALFGKTRVYDDLALHPLLLGVCDKLFKHYQLSAPVGLWLGADETVQPIHYDDLIYPLPWPHQHVVLSTIFALCDFSEANGGTRMVPGSHRWPRDRQPTAEEAIAIEMPAGSALMYVGSTWHGSGANQTDQPRPSLLMEYVASWLRPQETHLLSVPPEMARELPPKLQELLGYNIYPPFVGYVDGRHPRHTFS